MILFSVARDTRTRRATSPLKVCFVGGWRSCPSVFRCALESQDNLLPISWKFPRWNETIFRYSSDVLWTNSVVSRFIVHSCLVLCLFSRRSIAWSCPWLCSCKMSLLIKTNLLTSDAQWSRYSGRKMRSCGRWAWLQELCCNKASVYLSLDFPCHILWLGWV